MALEVGRRILSQLPVGDTANTAGPLEQLISKPAGCSAVSRIGDHKCLVTVRSNPGLIADDLDCLDSM